MVVQPNKAIVGRNAFSHESGIHQDGILKKRQTYEIMDPKRIGLSGNQLILGKLSGRHAFEERTEKLGFKLSKAEVDKSFVRFKELADKKKYVFDEDIEALLEDEIGSLPEMWKLEFLKVESETGKKPSARLRLKYKNSIKESEAQGDGPIDACYKAIENLVKSGARITHYGIQSVTGGMDAQGEVVVKLMVDQQEVTGRGTSTDIIEASAKAYLFAVNKLSSPDRRKITQHSPV
jgi:2-isopropylmalate synthase